MWAQTAQAPIVCLVDHQVSTEETGCMSTNHDITRQSQSTNAQQTSKQNSLPNLDNTQKNTTWHKNTKKNKGRLVDHKTDTSSLACDGHPPLDNFKNDV